MIKHICFDLDGVLCDAREIHFGALNRALKKVDKKYVIDREAHLSTYDGLPTNKKLKLLTIHRGLPENVYDKIWREKQKATIDIISSDIKPDYRLMGLLDQLKLDGYIISVASNSIRESVKMMLLKTGLLEFVDFYYSNQDVKNPKPNSEMYLKCIIKAGVDTKETLIVEDSHIGRTAALNSGAYLCAVTDVEDVTIEKIDKRINEINKENEVKPKWQGGKMNVLIPMAGEGSRFAKAGFTFPKPMIDVNGKPMIQTVVDNLNIDATHIFIVRKEHYEKYNLQHFLNLISPNCKIVQVDELTEGAACTTLLAKEYINNDEPLIIANSDQFIEWDSNEFMYSMQGDNIDAGIVTFTATHPKWSFAKLNKDGYVERVAEKDPISDIATVGIYYWAHGSDYVKYAEQMIEGNDRVNNEFYVCPVFNWAIKDNKKIKIYPVKKMFGLGTPEDLKNYLDYK